MLISCLIRLYTIPNWVFFIHKSSQEGPSRSRKAQEGRSYKFTSAVSNWEVSTGSEKQKLLMLVSSPFTCNRNYNEIYQLQVHAYNSIPVLLIPTSSSNFFRKIHQWYAVRRWVRALWGPKSNPLKSRLTILLESESCLESVRGDIAVFYIYPGSLRVMMV